MNRKGDNKLWYRPYDLFISEADYQKYLEIK